MKGLRIREVMLLVLVVALGLGWALDHRRVADLVSDASWLREQVLIAGELEKGLRAIAVGADERAREAAEDRERLRAELADCREGRAPDRGGDR